jgi:hypothetical protein
MTYDAWRVSFDGDGSGPARPRERVVLAVTVRDAHERGREVAALPRVLPADLGDTLRSLRVLFPSPRYDMQALRRYEAGSRC